MHCYKCSTQDNLSLKSHNPKTGYSLYICKDCRNAEYRHKPKTKPIDTSRLVEESKLSRLRIVSKCIGVRYG